MTAASMEKIDELIRRDGPYMPRWGWHDDHREADGTPGYEPALQQVRAEFASLLDVVVPVLAHGTGYPTRALQLGLGACRASHDVLQLLCGSAVTIDSNSMLYSCPDYSQNLQKDVVATAEYPGRDTHSQPALHLARSYAPYDFLLVDAGHQFEDVSADHRDYGALVRPGGIIAFHDSEPREGYPELGVRRYLETLEGVHYIGTEVGVAWVQR